MGGGDWVAVAARVGVTAVLTVTAVAGAGVLTGETGAGVWQAARISIRLKVNRSSLCFKFSAPSHHELLKFIYLLEYKQGGLLSSLFP